MIEKWIKDSQIAEEVSIRSEIWSATVNDLVQ